MSSERNADTGRDMDRDMGPDVGREMGPDVGRPIPHDRHGAASTEMLQTLRQDIDAVDEEIIAAIVRRMTLARAIGTLKQRTGQPVLDPAREASVVSRAAMRGRDAGLPEQDVRALYWQLMAWARRAQMQERLPGQPHGPIPGSLHESLQSP